MYSQVRANKDHAKSCFGTQFTVCMGQAQGIVAWRCARLNDPADLCCEIFFDISEKYVKSEVIT